MMRRGGGGDLNAFKKGTSLHKKKKKTMDLNVKLYPARMRRNADTRDITPKPDMGAEEL